MVGVSFAARMAPFFFLGILSGAVADRVDRRVFLRFVTFSGSLTAALLALVLIADVVQVWHVMALTVASGCTWAFVETVRQAYAYDIVGPERALNGLALSAFGRQIGGLFGALAAGFIISGVGMGGQYLAIASSFAAASVILLATREVGQAALTRRESVLQNLRGYIHLIRTNRTLLILMFLASTTEIFGFTHHSLLPVFARDALGVGPLGLGIMMTFRQAGAMTAVLLLANLGNENRKGRLMFIAATAFGVGQIVLSRTGNLVLFVVLLGLVNACAQAVDALYKVLMQANVPNEQRGRAMGSWVMSLGTAPMGHVGIGAIAGVLGAPGALLINGGVLTFVSAVSLIGMPRIRRLP